MMVTRKQTSSPTIGSLIQMTNGSMGSRMLAMEKHKHPTDFSIHWVPEARMAWHNGSFKVNNKEQKS